MQRKIKRQANDARSSSINYFDHILIDHDDIHTQFSLNHLISIVPHIYIRRNLMLKIWTSYYEQICVQKVVCRFSHINPWVFHIWYTYTCIYFRGKSVALSKSTYHLSQACTIEPWWSNSICLNFTIQFSNGFWACPAFSSKPNQFVISKHLKSVRKYESPFKFPSRPQDQILVKTIIIKKLNMQATTQ